MQRKERLGCPWECRASLNQRRLHSSRGPVREADADPFLHRNLWGSKLLCCKQSLWGPVAVPAEPGSAGSSCLFLRPQGWRMGWSCLLWASVVMGTPRFVMDCSINRFSYSRLCSCPPPVPFFFPSFHPCLYVQCISLCWCVLVKIRVAVLGLYLFNLHK